MSAFTAILSIVGGYFAFAFIMWAWDCVFGLPVIGNQVDLAHEKSPDSYSFIFFFWVLSIPLALIGVMHSIRARRIEKLNQIKRVRVEFEAATEKELALLDEEFDEYKPTKIRRSR